MTIKDQTQGLKSKLWTHSELPGAVSEVPGSVQEQLITWELTDGAWELVMCPQFSISGPDL